MITHINTGYHEDIMKELEKDKGMGSFTDETGAKIYLDEDNAMNDMETALATAKYITQHSAQESAEGINLATQFLALHAQVERYREALTLRPIAEIAPIMLEPISSAPVRYIFKDDKALLLQGTALEGYLDVAKLFAALTEKGGA